MIRILIIVLLLLPFIAFSQQFISKSKEEVKKEIQAYVAQNDSLKVVTTETDSMIRVSVKGNSISPAEFIYSFDRRGKCILQETKAFCDSCLKKFLGSALKQKKYRWKKINENQYVSKYSKRLLLEIPPENKDYSFRILQTNWTKKMYRELF